MSNKKLFLCALIVLSSFRLFAEGRLKIELTGIDPGRGRTILLSLYSSSKAFDQRMPTATDRIEINPETVNCSFILEDVPAGDIMILGLQDGNDNLEMDTGRLFGIPKEGFFCSQNASRPSWNKCRFDYDGGDSMLRLEMIYW